MWRVGIVFLLFAVPICITRGAAPVASPAAEVVTFPSGNLTLHGYLYKPAGPGPFPAVIYNHGSAPGMLSAQAFDALAPAFVTRGWVLFGPFRRGQGLSVSAGPYIGDEISAAEKAGGMKAAAATAVRLLSTDHLKDQLAALAWLRSRPYVNPKRVATMGTSFGGILVVLGAEKNPYCAAVDVSGAAEGWKVAPELQDAMTHAVQNSRSPIFFIQPENDYDLSPSQVLSTAMKNAHKEFELKIFRPFGKTVQDAHSFGYFATAIWGDDVFRFLNSHCPE